MTALLCHPVKENINLNMTRREELGVVKHATVIPKQKDKHINFPCVSLHTLTQKETAGCVCLCGASVNLTLREVNSEHNLKSSAAKKTIVVNFTLNLKTLAHIHSHSPDTLLGTPVQLLFNAHI